MATNGEMFVSAFQEKVAIRSSLSPHDALKVTYHPLYCMNKFVTNVAKLPLDGAQLFPYMG